MKALFQIRNLFLVSLVGLASCSYDFRDKQEAYNSAVVGGTPLQHAEVLKNLTPDYIAGLNDPKLQSNAWTIRSVAAWQAKEYAAAKTAADRGLPIAIDQSRDEIILKSIYGLVPASEALDTWQAANPKTGQTYDEVDDNLKTAWRKLGDAEKAAGTRTPPEIMDWVHYNKAVVTENWASMINALRTAIPMRAWAAIRQDARSALGDHPQATSDAERDKISAGSPLRGKLNR